MILLHDTAGNEIAIRACDISRADRLPAITGKPAFTIVWAVRGIAEWTDLHVTETPTEIVAMMRDYAKGWA